MKKINLYRPSPFSCIRVRLATELVAAVEALRLNPESILRTELNELLHHWKTLQVAARSVKRGHVVPSVRLFCDAAFSSFKKSFLV